MRSLRFLSVFLTVLLTLSCVVSASSVVPGEISGLVDATTPTDVLTNPNALDYPTGYDPSAWFYGEITGAYYFRIYDLDSEYELLFYIPSDFSTDSFALDANGDLINISNEIIYAYSLEDPSAVFGFPRYATLCRWDDGYWSQLWYELIETNVSVNTVNPNTPLSDDTKFVVVASVLILGFALLCFFKRG